MCLREQTWFLSCSSSSLMTWILGQNIPSASCRGQNRKKWIIHQRVVLLSAATGTLTGWRKGLTGTPCCSTRAVLHLGTAPQCLSTCRKSPSTTKEKPGGPGRLQIEYKPAVLPCVKANGVLNCIRQSVASRSQKMILPLCSALMRPSLGCSVQFWAAWHKRYTELLVRCQQRVTKMIKGMKSLSYE